MTHYISQGGEGELSYAMSEQGHFTIRGSLSFATVEKAHPHTLSLIAAAPLQISVDMAGVTQADSAGVALMIEWWRNQRLRHGVLEFINVPSQILAIADACGVNEVLPLQPLPRPHLEVTNRREEAGHGV
ncbi:MAG: STAS domain-containing protein [Gammaproteobacteria bacterium]|nr:STAS domain-containing protein [Gammaproteobacteria bacterium]